MDKEMNLYIRTRFSVFLTRRNKQTILQYRYFIYEVHDDFSLCCAGLDGTYPRIRAFIVSYV